MRSGPLAKNTRLGPMRKLASGPYSRAVSSKKLRRTARNWRTLPPTIVPFGPGGSPDRIAAIAVLIKIYGVSAKPHCLAACQTVLDNIDPESVMLPPVITAGTGGTDPRW